MKEFVVTLKNKEDLDDFYAEMESICNSNHIPNRPVQCLNRREISRNTHYLLTQEEANLLKNDPRVLAVELTPDALGMVIRPSYAINSSYWDKSSSDNSNYVNWGLIRCVEGDISNTWGSDNTSNKSASNNITSSGKNVDVVIVDGHLNPDHPEYALYSDGTGGSRVIQYNWLQHNPIVTGGAAGTYVYTPYVNAGDANATADNDHGAHVAGTIAGNNQGWARSANIYNINPYSTNQNVFDTLYLFDYIRQFHSNKAINPVIGRKNPTILNNSWGYSYSLLLSQITYLNYRGTIHNGPFANSAAIEPYGLFVSGGGKVIVPARYTALEADMQDAVNDGIIIVCAGGNDSMKMDISGGLDYNNWLVIDNAYSAYYHQGQAPGGAAASICVGAVDATSIDRKVYFSNTGPRIDIYAPGTYIMSSLNSTGVNDLRNASYKLKKYSGTSMASPQVCGVLACLLEQYPNLTQAQALEYLIYYSEKEILSNSGGGYTDFNSLQGSANRILHYYKERPDSGLAHPKRNYKIRPSTGSIWPRPKIKVK